jgi:hypothetical protein
MGHSTFEKNRLLRSAALCALVTGVVVAIVLIGGATVGSAARVRSVAPSSTSPSEQNRDPEVSNASSPQAKLSDSVATPDGTAYAYSETNGTATVTAGPTTGGNNREFFWDSKGITEADSEACATFSGNEGATYDQPGIALRITNNGNQAVTVTENVWGGIRNVFNFHTWNTATPGVFTLFAQKTISALPVAPPAWPLFMCARITGTTMQFVVWTQAMTQPAWGDPTWGGQATLPASAPGAGQAGFYAGHVEPGTSMTYSDLTVDGAATGPQTPAPAAPVHETVDLFGDSLGYQAAPYLDKSLAETGNYTVSNNTFGGTAPCDWLTKMAVAAATHPKAAVLVFSGNAFTPCMDGVALRSPQYYDLYTTNTEQAIGIFGSVSAHVFLVGTPIDASSTPGWDRLDDIYRQLAEANPAAVTYVDAGTVLESPSGGFTWSLPCLGIEPSCSPNGTDIVRSPDGIHFCPDGTPATAGVTEPCDEYSPGAFRFALAIASAVTRYPDQALASALRSVR